MNKNVKDDVIRFRIEANIKELVKKAAELEERKPSDYLTRLIVRDLKDKNLM